MYRGGGLQMYAQLEMVKIDISVLEVIKMVLMVFGFHCDADLDINLTQPKQNLRFCLICKFERIKKMHVLECLVRAVTRFEYEIKTNY